MSIWGDIHKRANGIQKKKEDLAGDCHWMGIPGIRMIWHGDFADPELEYDGKILNYWEVINHICGRCEYECGQKNANDPEFFEAYCKKNADWIKELFEIIWKN